MKKNISLLFILFFMQHIAFSQDEHLIDSLELRLKIFEEKKLSYGKNLPRLYDTIKANILNKLFYIYIDFDKNKAMSCAKQMLTVSEKMGYKIGVAKAYNNIGTIMRENNDYFTSLELHNKSLLIFEEIGDQHEIAGQYNNIGNIYLQLDNYPDALNYYFKALRLNSETGNKQWQAFNLQNISVINMMQGNYSEALAKLISAGKLIDDSGVMFLYPVYYLSIGEIYEKQENTQKALDNYNKYAEACQKLAYLEGQGISSLHIGSIYQNREENEKALKLFFFSLEIFEKNENNLYIAETNLKIGSNYYKQNNYDNAKKYLNKALTLSLKIRSLRFIREAYELLSQLEKSHGHFSLALNNYEFFILYRDSVLNIENTKKEVGLQMQYDFDKKESITNALQEKKDIQQRNIRNSILAGLLGALIFGMVVYRQRNKISKARKQSDELLLNILPEEVAEELKAKGEAEAKQFDKVTVMFTDFKGFTQISEKLTPKELVNKIHTCFKAFDEIIVKHNIEKIKTIGDAYMCVGGLPVANITHANDVVKAAIEIQQFMLNHLEGRNGQGKEPFEIRIGIHTGPVVAGIVGVKKFAYDIWGDTVNTASRMESSGEAGKINISGATFELIKQQFSCTYRGKIEAKNKGEIDMYFLESSTNA